MKHVSNILTALFEPVHMVPSINQMRSELSVYPTPSGKLLCTHLLGDYRTDVFGCCGQSMHAFVSSNSNRCDSFGCTTGVLENVEAPRAPTFHPSHWH